MLKKRIEGYFSKLKTIVRKSTSNIILHDKLVFSLVLSVQPLLHSVNGKSINYLALSRMVDEQDVYV